MFIHTWKQYVKTNNINSNFQTITSDVPQSSIVGSILFNNFFKDYFFFQKHCLFLIFSDDNILSSFDKTVNNLESILEFENDCAMGLKILV